MSSNVISVVIVGFNSGHIIGECVRPFATNPRFEVILVDNQSVDDTVDSFVKVCPTGRVLRRTSNGGFAVAVNAGASTATGDHLLLLNPDVETSVEVIDRLSNALAASEKGAIIGPMVDDPYSDDRVIAAGRFPTIPRMFLHMSGLSRLSTRFGALEGHYLMGGGTSSGVREVDWVTGGCLLVDMRAWSLLGGLSERWFMYAEDIEFCYRAKEMNFSVLLDRSSVVAHRTGTSSSGIVGRTTTVWLENLYDFYSHSISRGRVANFTWRHLVKIGFRCRACVFHLLAAWSEDRRSEKLAKRDEFVVYASAL